MFWPVSSTRLTGRREITTMLLVIMKAALAVIVILAIVLVPGCAGPSEPVETTTEPTPTPSVSGEDALELARRFCPVVHLNADAESAEHFQPDAVQLMVNVSLLRDVNNPSFAEQPTVANLLRWFQSDYYLDVPDLDPRSHSIADYKASYDMLKEGYLPTVYARVVEDAEYTVVQYWLFYYMNDWRNVHEGDWEMVQLHFPKRPVDELLADAVPPLFAGYSQHQSGQRMTWTDMETAGLVTDGTHPVVYVARGSHANYFMPGQFWSGLDFDDTGLSDWRVIEPEQLDIVLLQDADPEPEGLEWMGFRGYWGEYIGFSISILDLTFWQRGPFGPPWSDGGERSKKWLQPAAWADGLAEYPDPFWTSFLDLPGDWSHLAVFHLFSPADLHVYDTEGRHVGLDEEGRLQVEIPEAVYIQPEGTDYKIILVPEADAAGEYRIEVRGTDTGKMDIKAQVPDVREKLNRFLEYIGVPVKPKLVARAVIRPEVAEVAVAAPQLPPGEVKVLTARDTVTELEIDDDGDGIFESRTAPGVFRWEGEAPTTSPVNEVVTGNTSIREQQPPPTDRENPGTR